MRAASLGITLAPTAKRLIRNGQSSVKTLESTGGGLPTVVKGGNASREAESHSAFRRRKTCLKPVVNQRILPCQSSEEAACQAPTVALTPIFSLATQTVNGSNRRTAVATPSASNALLVSLIVYLDRCRTSHVKTPRPVLPKAHTLATSTLSFASRMGNGRTWKTAAPISSAP